MIVRIQAEGQYRLTGSDLDLLNDIDSRIVAAVSDGDEAAFRRLLGEMLGYVRKQGRPLPPEELVESDLILPSDDLTFREAQGVFTGEGLIPG